MLNIGREGKRRGFDTETQEVMSTEGKGQGFETETHEVLRTWEHRFRQRLRRS